MAARSLENEAPYFVDYISQELQDRYKVTGAVDVYTTLDVHLQKIAQDAVRDGLVRIDAILARRKRQPAQAALVAIDPRTGDILALIGGRSYNQSQFNRADQREPPARFGLQAVRVPRGLRAGIRPGADRHHSGNGRDGRADDVGVQFAGVDAVQLRRRVRRADHICAGRSRCRATSRRSKSPRRPATTRSPACGVALAPGTPPRPYPSIALGVFEATPLQVASAYTLFPNYGAIRPLRAILRMVDRRQRRCRFRQRATAHRRPARHDVSGHEHDAQRPQRGDGRRRARRRLQP